jgi:hypothetical protein
MSDYPHDNGPKMSQVHNGEKMLLDIPSDVTTPAVRVNDKIYFVGELLQRISGSYFIPERFFTRDIPNHTRGEDGKELYSLGWEVARSEVCVSVHSHILLICRTLLDWVCCEWRTSHHQSQNICTKLRGYREPSRRIEVRIFWYVFHLRRTLYALTSVMNARMFYVLQGPDASSTPCKSWPSHGLLRSSSRFHGRCLREHIEAMEQASCHLYVKCKSTPRNAREGILCLLCHIFASCLPNGVDASNEGIDNVSVGPCSN